MIGVGDALRLALGMLAALGVFGTGTAWLDMIVGGIMAGLSAWGRAQIMQAAHAELRLAAGSVRMVKGEHV